MRTALANPKVAPRSRSPRAPAGPPRRARHRPSGGILAVLALLTATIVPVYAISTGRARWAERLVPAEEALRLAEYLGQASSQTIILLFLGIFAFLVAVWAAVCATTYTVGAMVDQARRRHRG